MEIEDRECPQTHSGQTGLVSSYAVKTNTGNSFSFFKRANRYRLKVADTGAIFGFHWGYDC